MESLNCCVCGDGIPYDGCYATVCSHCHEIVGSCCISPLHDGEATICANCAAKSSVVKRDDLPGEKVQCEYIDVNGVQCTISAVDILKCDFGGCAPITFYCRYHYTIVHDPEEGEEQDDSNRFMALLRQRKGTGNDQGTHHG